MSDCGFDVDELIRKRRNSMNLFGIVTDKITGNIVSYPYISNDNVEYVSKDIESTAKSNNSNNQVFINPKGEKFSEPKNKKSTRSSHYLWKAGNIQETFLSKSHISGNQVKNKCYDCLKKEKCKLEVQGLLDLCKEIALGKESGMFSGNGVSNNFSYPENWYSIRKIVYKRANHTCEYCGNSGLKLNAHHIVPLSKGGKNELANLVCICDQCHSILHHNNLKLEKKAELSIQLKYEFDVRFNRALFEENKISEINEIFEDTQDFHSIEDNIIAPF